jgi:hypothetical protein
MSDDATQQIQQKFDSLVRRYDKFEDLVRLNDLSKSIVNVADDIRKYPLDIQTIREKGYVFRKYLENMAQVLDTHWNERKATVERAIATEQRRLHQELTGVKSDIELARQVESVPSKLAHVLPGLEQRIAEFEKTVEAAQRNVQNQFDTVRRDSEALKQQIREINQFIKILNEASFKLLMGESLYMVSSAEWVQDKKNTPNGYLYLTDHRLIFEQDEKVGKTLGLFGGKQVKEIRWEVNLNQVDSLEFENKGFFGGKDMVYLNLKDGTRHTVEVKGSANNKFWIKQIERMIAGETNDERAIQPEPELIEALKNAPTACHVCGATLPMLVANQRQIECEYCGSVIRIG